MHEIKKKTLIEKFASVMSSLQVNNNLARSSSIPNLDSIAFDLRQHHYSSSYNQISLKPGHIKPSKVIFTLSQKLRNWAAEN